MSARAAWRLESLGFGQVYDYAAGEADWIANGLPRAGRNATVPRVGDVARREVPTCSPSETVGAVRERVRAAGWDQCLVVNDERVVFGRLDERALAGDPHTPVEAVMAAGPTTFRPGNDLADTVERMRDRNVGSVVVTTSDGRLVGLLLRSDAERALAG